MENALCLWKVVFTESSSNISCNICWLQMYSVVRYFYRIYLSWEKSEVKKKHFYSGAQMFAKVLAADVAVTWAIT